MLGVIQGRLDEGRLGDDPLARVLDHPSHRTAELHERAFKRIVTAACDHIHDRLRLGEVDPSVQEGPLRELAGLGEPRSVPQNKSEDLLHHIDAAVAVDLHGVLRRVGVRSPHQHDKDFVQFFIFIENEAIMNRVRLHLAQVFPAVRKTKNSFKHHKGFRPRNPNDSDA